MHTTTMHTTTYVDPALRAAVLDAHPGLRCEPRYFNLLQEVLYPIHFDDDTFAPVLSSQRLAELDGKASVCVGKNYQSQPYLDAYTRTTGHRFRLSVHSFWEGKARTVLDIGLDPALEAVYRADLAQMPMTPVAFTSGQKLRRNHLYAARDHDQTRANDCPSSYAETQAAIQYLNSQTPNFFTSMMRKYGDEALAVALQSENPPRRHQNQVTLRYMFGQPQQFYRASKRGRSRRLFPAHCGLNTLSKDVAAVLLQDCLEFDLASSQLAICAYLWQVPSVIAFLESGCSIWAELIAFLGLEPHNKPALKVALYSLIYGASDRRIVRDLNLGLDLGDESRAIAERLLQHPLIANLSAAREQRLAQVKRDGGARDCYGAWIPIPADRYGRKSKKQSRNPRSVLAQQAQAIEFRVLAPVFTLMQDNEDASIVQWAHDGFTLRVRDKQRMGSWVERLSTAVANEAATLGIRTRLEVTRDPRQR